MTEILENLPYRLYDNFNNKTIFLTGGTGFLGKVMIERLLRLFDVKVIYILIRCKHEKDVESRYNALFASPLFDKVREMKGDQIFEKCIVINGDVAMPNLNISPENRLKLQKEVQFVIHSAATVKFNEPLKKALLINTKGTQSMLALAKKMERLQIFVHVSTAYCHPEQKVLHEQRYPPPAPPHKILDMVDWMSDDMFTAASPKLLGDAPNTYTYSKALSEELVLAEMDNLPVIVVRPSIVGPTWKEPIPGWTDNLNGPTGILIGAGKGVIRSIYGNKDAHFDCMPVDVVADQTFYSMTHYLLETSDRSRRIFHICCGKDLIITWGELTDFGKEVIYRVPFDRMLWLPTGGITSTKIQHVFVVIFYQLLPALVVDTLVFCCGCKPFLWKIQKRLLNNMTMLEYYINNEWIFMNANIHSFKDWLNTREMATYIINLKDFDFLEYLIDCTLAARRYILKEPDENLPRAKRNMKILTWVDRIFGILFKLVVAYFLYKLVMYFYI